MVEVQHLCVCDGAFPNRTPTRGLNEGSGPTAQTFSGYAREGHPVDEALLRVRSPKVAETELETFSARRHRSAAKYPVRRNSPVAGTNLLERR
ncbi:MAG TPA: hypothetical protein DCF65_00410 [Chloroflexi bacterium]|nr:hypothetical protein [Chloroflexota bacterium]